MENSKTSAVVAASVICEQSCVGVDALNFLWIKMETCLICPFQEVTQIDTREYYPGNVQQLAKKTDHLN